MDLSQLEQRVARLERQVKRLARDVAIGRPNVSVVLAALESRPPWEPSSDLASQGYRFTSQNNEDGMLYALFRYIGTTDKRAVEIACGDNGGNAGLLVMGLGFKGLFVDGNPKLVASCRKRFAGYSVTVTQDWLTTERINEVLVEHGFTGDLDYVGLDLDGNDYWIWEAMSVTRPRVVVTEYNSVFPRDRSLVIPYNPDHQRRRYDGTPKTAYFGASLAALAMLAMRKGYRLIAVDQRGVNAFWLREDVAPEIPRRLVSEAWRPCTARAYAAIRAAMGAEDAVAFFARHDLPLVEIEG